MSQNTEIFDIMWNDLTPVQRQVKRCQAFNWTNAELLFL